MSQQSPYGQPSIVPSKPPKKSRRRRWIIIGVIGGSLIFLCILCSIIGNLLPKAPIQVSSPTATTAPAQIQPIVTQTSTSVPTIISTNAVTPTSVHTIKAAPPTPKPTTSNGGITATYGTPRLGGPTSDFYGKYGSPNDHTSGTSYGTNSHWFRDSSSSADGLIVWNLTHYPQVDSIDVAPVNGTAWTSTTAEAACTVYNPSDACKFWN